MSRTGKLPITVPDGVDVSIDGAAVFAKGKLGELSYLYGQDVGVNLEDKLITVSPKGESKHARSMWGTARSCIDNLVRGVSEGFSKVLEINGVGYRAEIKGRILELQLGYSHGISFPIPEGIDIACPKPTEIVISGIDRQKVGQVAANIRAFRKPEPYKGKGIKYIDERILRKEGKKK